ncbi:hypothetical protein [Novipirellula galeiformis]|uniref:hypothetical protein n=1 Tax=Novipirellula galeiformis TaxID=2528004 RepID=UPI0011B71666|nr:hypothetical protein [Novipirellula galeiformis]
MERFAVVSHQIRHDPQRSTLERARVLFWRFGQRIVDAVFTTSILSDGAAVGASTNAKKFFRWLPVHAPSRRTGRRYEQQVFGNRALSKAGGIVPKMATTSCRRWSFRAGAIKRARVDARVRHPARQDAKPPRGGRMKAKVHSGALGVSFREEA